MSAFDDCVDRENIVLTLWARDLIKLLNGDQKGSGVRGGAELEEVEVRIVAMQARIQELEKANERKAFRLNWIYDNFGDTTAMRFSMEADDSEIDEAMKATE